MTTGLTIIDLIRNGTLSAEVATTLWAALHARRSFIVVAIPRFAGKTTMTNALLGLLPHNTPIHRLSGSETEMQQLKEDATGGYLVVGEFSQGPASNYIWGSPVRRVFDTMTAGYSLTAAMHAPGMREAFSAICEGNEVSDEAASRIDLVLYIRRFGENEQTFWRRLAEVYEIDRVQDGQPKGRLLHRWIEAEDRFEAVETPHSFGFEVADRAHRTFQLQELAQSGRTTASEVAQLVTLSGGELK